MASELKPCPFCGGNNLDTYYCDIEGWIAHIKCDDCDDMIGPMSEYKYESQEEAYEDAATRWNTRPAPATTETGLETVMRRYRGTDWPDHYPWAFLNESECQGEPGPRWTIEKLCLQSQAEELLAAEIRRERDLAEKQLSEVVDRMSDDYLALKAELDQAVGVIEDRSSEYEALEAKLTAAEKALKSARPYVEDYDTRRHNTGVDETLTQIDAALGGKPL